MEETTYSITLTEALTSFLDDVMSQLHVSYAGNWG